MKKQDLKSRKGLKPDRLGTVSPLFRLFVLCFCFTLLPLRLISLLVGVASAGTASQTTPETVQSISAVSIDPNSPLQRELWRAEIGAAEKQEDETSKMELCRMIELIRSVTFEPVKRIDEPVAAPVEVRPTEPAESLVDTALSEAEKEPKRAAPQSRLPYGPVGEKTMQMLRVLLKHPEKVDNPFELGETLFLSGNPAEAAVFYTEALNRTEPNDVDPAGNRAWILFQTGNCLRNSDMPAATKMYHTLLTEYPDSTWAQLAQAQVQLVDWYMKNEPRKLVAERK